MRQQESIRLLPADRYPIKHDFACARQSAFREATTFHSNRAICAAF
jgi:hypothetical protein